MNIKKLIKIFCFLMICIIFSTLFFHKEKKISTKTIVARQEEKILSKTPSLKSPSSAITSTTRTPAFVETKTNQLLMTNREKTKEIYHEMMNYPDYSAPIDDKKSIDHIESKFSPDVKQTLGENDPSVVMVSWSEKNYYSIKDKVIRFYALFSKSGKSINAQNIKANLNNGLEVPFRPQALGEYVGELGISQIKTGQYMMQIDANVLGETLTSISGFKVEDQYFEYKKMEKSFLDSTGNLIFKHQVNILKAGTYLLEGMLYDSQGKIIAGAHNAVDLTQGVHSINLNFYGYIFYKKKMSGPFNLKNIQLAYVDENLATYGEQRVILNALTDKYEWDQFNSEPFNNPVIESKLNQLKD